MALTIKNPKKRMQPFNLTNEALREAGPPYGYVVVTGGVVDHEPTSGARHVRPTRKAVPAVLTFLAEEQKSGLPNAIKDCPEVAAALADGRLRLVAETADAANDASPAAPTKIGVDLSQLQEAPKTELVTIRERAPGEPL